MNILQSASDIQLITSVHDILAKLETNIQLSSVAIKLAGLNGKIQVYDSNKVAAHIIRDLCEKDSEVKNAVIEELNNSSLAVDDDFLETAFGNLS